MWISSDWKDYELLDCGGGERLERWGSSFLTHWPPPVEARWYRASCLRHPGCRPSGRQMA